MLLGEKKFRVLLTGGKNERTLLKSLAAGVPQNKPLRLCREMSLEDLIGVIATASAVVAPSTGPLHLAAALGTPLAGIYSPVRVHHPDRWGPLGPGRKKVFIPDVECPGVYRCLEERCELWPCMPTVRPEEVVEFIRSAVGK